MFEKHSLMLILGVRVCSDMYFCFSFWKEKKTAETKTHLNEQRLREIMKNIFFFFLNVCFVLFF